MNQAAHQTVFGSQTVEASPVAAAAHAFDGRHSFDQLRSGEATNCNLSVRAQKLINEAIELMPMEEKSDYLRAAERSPFLFECNAESDPLKFLRRCDHNHWEAAKRLCVYWKERIFLFGEKRAFLPMTLTGDGALNNQDIAFVEAGNPAFLPDLTKDGRPIVYFDRRQWPPVKKLGYERARSMFYIMTVAAENEQAQTKGVCCLYLMTTQRLKPHDPDLLAIAGRTVQIMANALPVKIQTHFLSFPPRNKHMYTVQNMITSFVDMCVKNGLDLGDQLEFLFEREKGDIYKHLTQELGMTRAGIPTVARGTWTFVDAQHWCKSRFKREVAQHGKRLEQIHAEDRKRARVDQTLATDRPARINRYNRTARPAAAKPDDEETKLFKKRSANAVFSRRKRQRRQHEEKLLNEEHARLTQEQFSLREEQARLESLLQDAKHIVERMPLEQGSPAQAGSHLLDPHQATHQPRMQYQSFLNNGRLEQQQPQQLLPQLQQQHTFDDMAPLDISNRSCAPDDILTFLMGQDEDILQSLRYDSVP